MSFSSPVATSVSCRVTSWLGSCRAPEKWEMELQTKTFRLHLYAILEAAHPRLRLEVPRIPQALQCPCQDDFQFFLDDVRLQSSMPPSEKQQWTVKCKFVHRRLYLRTLRLAKKNKAHDVEGVRIENCAWVRRTQSCMGYSLILHLAFEVSVCLIPGSHSQQSPCICKEERVRFWVPQERMAPA